MATLTQGVLMTSQVPGERQYRRLTEPATDLASILLAGPKLDGDTAEVFTEIAAEREADFACAVDLGTD